jgi:hypothetical protein
MHRKYAELALGIPHALHAVAELRSAYYMIAVMASTMKVDGYIVFTSQRVGVLSIRRRRKPAAVSDW